LAQDEESGLCGGETGRRGGLGAVKDTLAVLGHLLVCAVLSLLAGFMIWEIVEYAHPEWKAQPWGSHATKGQ
jgi:hypothetical protein